MQGHPLIHSFLMTNHRKKDRQKVVLNRVHLLKAVVALLSLNSSLEPSVCSTLRFDPAWHSWVEWSILIILSPSPHIVKHHKNHKIL